MKSVHRMLPRANLLFFLIALMASGPVATNAQASDLIISGVIDGPLSGGLPKAVEIYVVNDIPDLSIYGFGSANNGGGSDGEEFIFAPVAVSAGTFLYVASEGVEFADFFGFAPDFVNAAANINGDDAIELFQNDTVADIFGEIDVDGTGQPWEYMDGWAYRAAGTGPDGSSFVPAHWIFSGANALDGETTNDATVTPIPIGSYSAVAMTSSCGDTANFIHEIQGEGTISPLLSGVTPLADIVDGLNAILGMDSYAYINTGTIGGDAIKVGIMYKSSTVSPQNGHALLDSTVDPRFIDDRNRPVLAQSFVENSTGAIFTVAVNHLKSKGSGCGAGDDDPQQGNCNHTRTMAAEALVDWLATDPTGAGDGDFLIIGDLNSYGKEDPIRAIKAGTDDSQGTGDDYTDLIATHQGELAYSYLFDGQFGYLDYALSSPGLTAQVTGGYHRHVPEDYHTDLKRMRRKHES